MNTRLSAARTPAFLALLATLVCAKHCVAQQPPRQLDISITSAVQLSDSHRRLIQDYADYWCTELSATASASQRVEAARTELIRPLNAVVQPSLAFRFEYSSRIVPALETILEAGDRPHPAFNAAVVLGELSSRQALTVLIRNADSRTQPRREIRIQASMNAAKSLIMHANDENVLKPREVGVAVRGLRNAAQREDDPLVLRHLLTAMQAVGTPESQEALIAAMDVVVDKIAQQAAGRSPLVEPFYTIVYRRRNQFINLNRADQQRLGPIAGPVLGKFIRAASTNWDAIHGDPELVERFGGPIRTCESMLKVIVGSTGAPPPTSLRLHWDNGNKEEFQKEVEQWNEVLSRPPFNR